MRVQRLVGVVALLRGVGRAAVGRRRIGPGADAGEDVRGHVQRVRRVGRDLGVAARRGHALLRDRRRVVAVDQVMRDAGVIGMLGELLLEDPGRLELRGVRLVGRELRPGEVQRVEDLRLVVVRVFRRERLVGLGARELARALGRLAKSS